MKYFLVFVLFFIFSFLKCEDYIIDNNGTRTIVAEHKYSEKSLFRAFKLVGTFTDNLGNYGNWDAFVTTFVSNGKVLKLNFSSNFIYQNKKRFYQQGFREEGTDIGAGVGKAIITYSDKEFKSLLNSNCMYSVKFLGDTFFGKNKCKINKEALKVLKNVIEDKS